MDFETVHQFFQEFSGNANAEIKLLPQSGSARKNYLATAGDTSYIVTVNQNLRENKAFFYFSNLFNSLQLNTPEILRISPTQQMYIQEKVGDQTLSQIIEQEGITERVKALVKKSLEALYHLQQATHNNVDFSRHFEYAKYDRLPVIHDLYYFKNYFADILEIEYYRGGLLKEFTAIAGKIEQLEPQGLMLRDFQARNILVNEEDNVFFIDYQAAMQGPLLYDVVSLLYQAKADFPATLRQELPEYYLSLYDNEALKNQLRETLPYLQLVRFLQVLGAYGFRGLIQRKIHFIQSIEKGLKNLSVLTENWPEIKNYEQLHGILMQLHTTEIQQKIKNLVHGT